MHFVGLGHGGARTAEYLKNNLFNNLVTHHDFISDTKKAIGMKNVIFSFFASPTDLRVSILGSASV